MVLGTSEFTLSVNSVSASTIWVNIKIKSLAMHCLGIGTGRLVIPVAMSSNSLGSDPIDWPMTETASTKKPKILLEQSL